MAQGKEFPASSAQLHAPSWQAFCGLVCPNRFPLRHEQCKLVRVCVAVDSLLCKSLVVALDTDLKDPYPLDRAEVMAYLRDVVRQSNESERSEVRQQEPDYKKVS